MHRPRHLSAQRRHTATQGSVQRPWRTIEPAACEAKRQVIGNGGKRLAKHGFSFGGGDLRQKAGKTRMQAAARIGQAAAVIMMVMPLAVIGMAERPLIVVVRRKGGCHGKGARAWRGHHARKLGDQEQANQ